MEALRQIELWHLAVVAGLVAFLMLLGVACALWIMWRFQRSTTRELTHLRRRADDTWRVLNGFAAENGYSDNLTRTQVLDASVMDGLRKSR